MRLFRRVGDIVAANLNDLVDRFEDPDVMLKQAIREMETMIEEATVAAARAVAGERLLSIELEDHERRAARWKAVAEEAVAREDDDQARRAIARSHEQEDFALALADQHREAERTARALRNQVAAMHSKLAEARRKLAGLSARRQVVEARRSLRTAAAPSTGDRGFVRFERMRRKIELAEAEAEALGELFTGIHSDPDAELADRERARRVDAELASMKEKIQG